MARTRSRSRDIALPRRPRPVGRPADPAPHDPFPAFLSRATAWVLALGGAIGTAAAFALVLDKLALLADPAFVPSCSIDAVLSCGSVMTSPQAEVLGFPNPLIGLVAFPAVTTVGVVALAGGAVPRGVWLGLQAGTVAGLGFVLWLVHQSLYAIGTLCPYCMVVWVVTITVFGYTTLDNLVSGRVPVPAGWRRRARAAAGYHGALVASALVAVAALVAARFWSHWTGLLA